MLLNTNTYKLEGLTEINEKAIKVKTKTSTANEIINPNEFSSNQSSQCITYNKKYEHVVAGLDNGFITIRKSIKNLKLKFKEDVKICDKSIISVKFSPNDNFLAVLSEDEKLTILKVDNNYTVWKTFDDIMGAPIEMDWDTSSNYIQVINSNGEYIIYKIDKEKIKGKHNL